MGRIRNIVGNDLRVVPVCVGRLTDRYHDGKDWNIVGNVLRVVPVCVGRLTDVVAVRKVWDRHRIAPNRSGDLLVTNHRILAIPISKDYFQYIPILH